MIVISIILILISVAVPIYTQSILRSREAVLRDDLFVLRSCIDHYTNDPKKDPQSLDDLVTAGYLRQLPEDPFTRSRETWVVVQNDTFDDSMGQPGIKDVHSGSDATSSDGTPYSSW